MSAEEHPLHDQVLEALKNLRSPAAQRTSTLLQNPAIRDSLSLPWPDPSPDDLALALSRRLKEIIQQLRPTSEENLRQQDWLHYYALYYLFVQNRSADMVLDLLNISRSYLYKLRDKAVDSVATLLTAGEPAPASVGPAPGPVRLFSLAEPIPLATNFSGREGELAWYRNTLAQEKLAIIHGFAGTGKTALAAQLAAERQQAGQAVLWVTFYPQVNTNLDSFLHLLAHPLDELGYPDLLRFLGLCLQNSSQYPADARIQYALQCLAASGVALFLDDVHLTEEEPDLQRFLQRIAPRQQPACLPLVVTSRSMPSFAQGRLVPPLTGLTEADAGQLLHSAGIDWLDKGGLAELQRRIEGNVVFLKFFIAWAQREEIASRPGPQRSKRVASFLAQLSHLAGSQGLLIEEALTTLDAAERSTLERIVLCRKAVDLNNGAFAVLFTGLEAEPTDRALHRLERRNLLLRPRDTALYRAHSLVQDYVRTHLEHSPVRQVELHRVLADYCRHMEDWVEAAFHLVRAGELSAAAKMLVAHIDEVIARGQALAWIILAAEIPSQVLALEQRQAWYPALERAWGQTVGRSAETLAWLDQALAEENDPALRYTLLLVRDQIHSMQANRAAQGQDQRELEELAKILGDGRHRMISSWRKAVYALVTGDNVGAVAAAQDTIELAQTTGETFYETQGNRIWGWVALQQSDYATARVHLERSLALQQEAGQSEQDSLVDLGSLHFRVGDYARATSCWEQALEKYRRGRNVCGEVCCLNNLGQAASSRGYYDRAREYLEQSEEIAGRYFFHEEASFALAALSCIWLSLGDYGRAEELGIRGLQFARDVGNHPIENKCLLTLSDICLYRGDLAAAHTYLEQAMSIVEPTDSQGMADNLTTLGRLLAAEGRPQEAAPALTRALEIYRLVGEHRLALGPAAELARLFLAQGDSARAQSLAEEIGAELEKQSFLYGVEKPFSVYLACYRVFLAQDPGRAEQILARARAELQEQVDRIADEALRRSFMEKGPGHQEILRARF